MAWRHPPPWPPPTPASARASIPRERPRADNAEGARGGRASRRQRAGVTTHRRNTLADRAWAKPSGRMPTLHRQRERAPRARARSPRTHDPCDLGQCPRREPEFGDVKPGPDQRLGEQPRRREAAEGEGRRGRGMEGDPGRAGGLSLARRSTAVGAQRTPQSWRLREDASRRDGVTLTRPCRRRDWSPRGAGGMPRRCKRGNAQHCGAQARPVRASPDAAGSRRRRTEESSVAANAPAGASSAPGCGARLANCAAPASTGRGHRTRVVPSGMNASGDTGRCGRMRTSDGGHSPFPTHGSPSPPLGRREMRESASGQVRRPGPRRG